MIRLILFLLLVKSVYSQDSLMKYSYFVYGKKQVGKNIDSKQGTCLFIRKGGKIFLVSAKHVFTVWQSNDSSISTKRFDTLYIRFPKSDGKGAVFHPIDVRRYNDQIEGSYYYKDPDLFVIEFKAAEKYQINSIEKLFNNSLGNKNDNFICFGFPSAKNETPNNFMFVSAKNFRGTLISSLNENLNYQDRRRNVKVADAINYAVTTRSNVYGGGYSGAPVFIQDGKSRKWYFGGIVSQGLPIDRLVFIVKPSILINRIDGNLPVR